MKIIIDNERKLGDFKKTEVGYPIDLVKEEVARKYILGRKGTNMKFLDVGGRDGNLEYLLDMGANLKGLSDKEKEANRRMFGLKYEYYGTDLTPLAGNIIPGDLCSKEWLDPKYNDFFDVAYCNNVFEHLNKPWIAAENILKVLKPGGIAVIITHFAHRYHKCPEDYFRYTHVGLPSLFDGAKVLESGYDLTGRRNNWQGGIEGQNDIVPVDKFGAWREAWFVVTVVEK